MYKSLSHGCKLLNLLQWTKVQVWTSLKVEYFTVNCTRFHVIMSVLPIYSFFEIALQELGQ